MVPLIGSFQSAIQLVVGANLALFAFPDLRQPELEKEARNWVALVRTVPASSEEQDPLRAGMLKFVAVRRELERKVATVKVLCLWIAAVYAGLLFWTSYAADRPTDGLFLEVASVGGAIPSIILVGLNAQARCRLKELRVERERYERKAMERCAE